MTRQHTPRLLAGIASLCLTLSAGVAEATEGYVALGFGPVQRGQGGAGVAQTGQDAMAGTINPAAVADVPRAFSLGVELFRPDRGYSAEGTYFVAPGSLRSGRSMFPVPNFAYNHPLANGAVLNFAAFGNGGMNTSYPDVENANCGPYSGVYCAGPAGVDLVQLFLSATYAQSSGAFSWGIAPTIAIQAFEARGLAAFGQASVDADHLSDNGQDRSFGAGLRAGMRYAVAPGLRVGISGQTRMRMSRFKEYAGLFENGGSFDIPAQVTAGVAWSPTPATTLMLDYQKIFYSGVPAVSNAASAGPLGAKGGAGFGWKDVNVVKLGVEWKQSDTMTWRAGYAHASNPIGPEDVTLGILAPGVVEDHFTLGGSWAASARDSLDFAVIYVPGVTVRGGEATPEGPTPGQIAIDMDQVAFSLGWTRHF